MEREPAIKQAIIEAETQGIEITVYRDPIGNREDWETEDESWGYCPKEALPIAARFRELKHDYQIKPQLNPKK